MCILQDFEAITPNLLARTIETVEGGGLVVFLLNQMSSLQNLYDMVMEVHKKFLTESHGNLVARFNKRFLLSLANCPSALVMDDELNVLPISDHIRNIEPVNPEAVLKETSSQKELRLLKDSLKDTEPTASLVACAKTADQVSIEFMITMNIY